MPQKDYYELLELGPDATATAIKKAYRKLAMRFHPDKNIGNPYANFYFQEIQEAYEVLSNPVTRTEYHQQRWQYNQKASAFSANFSLTPHMLLKEAEKIANHLKTLDVFRMNYRALFNKIDQLLNQRHLSVLADAQNEAVNEKIIRTVMRAMEPLPYDYLFTIPSSLVQLAGSHNQLISLIYGMVKRKRKQFLWEKYKGLVMFSIALVACLVIYLLA
jgi:molecular chaperone DnaJ